MSHPSFMTALAHLIRTPIKPHGIVVKDILDQYDLTPKQRRQLAELSHVEQMEKYGLEQADDRFEQMLESLWYTRIFISPNDLEDLWFGFERDAIKVPSDHIRKRYTLAFLSHIMGSSAVQGELDERVGPWALDLLKYEAAEINHFEFVKSKEKPHLRRHVSPVKLDYDIPQAIRLAEQDQNKDDLTSVLPELRPAAYILTGGDFGPIESHKISSELYELLTEKEENILPTLLPKDTELLTSLKVI